MQNRIVELIGRINHDEITAELLRLNDELNNLFLRHQRFEKNRNPQAANTPSAILGAAMGVPTASENGKLSVIKKTSGEISNYAIHFVSRSINKGEGLAHRFGRR